MDDNPVTVEGNDREVIEGGGEFGGFKENFNVHGKSFRDRFRYASIIIYIVTFVNTSLIKNHNWHTLLSDYGWNKLHLKWIKKFNYLSDIKNKNSLFGKKHSKETEVAA